MLCRFLSSEAERSGAPIETFEDQVPRLKHLKKHAIAWLHVVEMREFKSGHRVYLGKPIKCSFIGNIIINWISGPRGCLFSDNPNCSSHAIRGFGDGGSRVEKSLPDIKFQLNTPTVDGTSNAMKSKCCGVRSS